MAGIIGSYAIGQFMKIGLCTGDSAFLEQSLQRRGVFFCGIVESPRASGGDKHGSVDIVFDYQGKSLKLAGLACFNVLIRNASAGFEVFFIQRNNCPQISVTLGIFNYFFDIIRHFSSAGSKFFQQCLNRTHAQHPSAVVFK